MDLTRVIVGPVITEKAERLKAAAKHTHVLRVDPAATKIDVRKALEKYFNVSVSAVRMVWTRAKTRSLGFGSMEKRHRYKKAYVTLTKDSKTLDLSSFQTH